MLPDELLQRCIQFCQVALISSMDFWFLALSCNQSINSPSCGQEDGRQNTHHSPWESVQPPKWTHDRIAITVTTPTHMSSLYISTFLFSLSTSPNYPLLSSTISQQQAVDCLSTACNIMDFPFRDGGSVARMRHDDKWPEPLGLPRRSSRAFVLAVYYSVLLVEGGGAASILAKPSRKRLLRAVFSNSGLVLPA